MNVVVKRRLLRNRYEDRRGQGVRWILPFALALFAFVSVSAAGAMGALFFAYQSYADGYVPIEEKIAERYVGLTKIYDRGGPDEGVYLGAIFNPQGQLLNPIPLAEMSPWMIEATVSTEDNSFWTNPGVNPTGLIRAAWENYAGGGIGSGTGGSSITQQLVKNIYLSTDCEVVDGTKVCIAPRTLDRKLKEIAYAFELEQDAPKEQILEWYLNSISYADRYVGIEAAAEGYFRKHAKDLTLAEAAVLAGIPSAPTKYHPRLNCVMEGDACAVDELGRTTLAGEAKLRQEYVLDLMVAHGRATPAQVAQAKREVIKVYPSTPEMKAQAWIESQVEPRLVRMCEAGLLPRTPGTDSCADSVRSGGYTVTSSLDWAKTQKAQEMMYAAIISGLEARCDCHNAAIATIEPATGQVIVYAPNIDPRNTSDPTIAGNIDQLTEINQPGSSFKPAVYLTWLDKLQKTPLSSIWDTSPLSLSDDQNVLPENRVTITNPRPGGGGEGLITMRLALGGSQNVPAFRVATEAGIENVIGMAKALGITTLQDSFDPTFYSHDAVRYGPSIATGGANVRPIDMAYMNATIANMGFMVGVPAYGEVIDPDDLLSLSTAEGDDYDRALQQRLLFQRGYLRLPGTRALDPVTVLRVEGINGELLYEHGADLQRVQVVDPGSVWMLHSVMSDCTARVIIWGCGASNDDLALDFFVDGVKIPGGVKTGTQQGFQSANDTLATWMNGYSRYAATAVWVGNADKSLVRDGPSANYAAANTTVRLFKRWMGQYHLFLRDAEVFTTPAGFDELRPANVKFGPFQTATTERGRRGGCNQRIDGWQRTDITYAGDCEGKGFMPLPAFKPELAVALARRYGIPTRAGQVAAPPPPSNGDSVAGTTPPAAAPTPVPTQPPQPTQPAQPTPPPATVTAQPTQPANSGGNGSGRGGGGSGSSDDGNSGRGRGRGDDD
ncbi:MAG: transglycosylase domain-containing protein [Dehalococcoidia bacterium]|nr:transglycosylase domain-containing protein [Dehalococcoidia bacterium]